MLTIPVLWGTEARGSLRLDGCQTSSPVSDLVLREKVEQDRDGCPPGSHLPFHKCVHSCIGTCVVYIHIEHMYMPHTCWEIHIHALNFIFLHTETCGLCPVPCGHWHLVWRQEATWLCHSKTTGLTQGLPLGPTGNFLWAIQKLWGAFYFSIVWSSGEDEARWRIAPKKGVCGCHLGGIYRRPLLRMLWSDNCFSQSHSGAWSTSPGKQWPWGSWGSS